MGAQVAGIRVARLLTLYHVLLALAVIASLSTVGIVLANALLVIPAATAKLLARSLAQMFWLAPLVGAVSVLVGLTAAYRLDLPSGPAIVVVAGLVFLTVWAARAGRGSRRGRGAARVVAPPGPGASA
jgi:manganese/iron transport system permease protein